MHTAGISYRQTCWPHILVNPLVLHFSQIIGKLKPLLSATLKAQWSFRFIFYQPHPALNHKSRGTMDFLDKEKCQKSHTPFTVYQSLVLWQLIRNIISTKCPNHQSIQSSIYKKELSNAEFTSKRGVMSRKTFLVPRLYWTMILAKSCSLSYYYPDKHKKGWDTDLCRLCWSETSGGPIWLGI